MKQPSLALASLLEIQLQEAVLQADCSICEGLRNFFASLEIIWLDLSEVERYTVACDLFPSLNFPRSDFRSVCGYFQTVALGHSLEETQEDCPLNECTHTELLDQLAREQRLPLTNRCVRCDTPHDSVEALCSDCYQIAITELYYESLIVAGKHTWFQGTLF